MLFPRFQAGVYIHDTKRLYRIVRRESFGNGSAKEFRLVVENAQGGVLVDGEWVYPTRTLEYGDLVGGKFKPAIPARRRK